MTTRETTMPAGFGERKGRHGTMVLNAAVSAAMPRGTPPVADSIQASSPLTMSAQSASEGGAHDRGLMLRESVRLLRMLVCFAALSLALGIAQFVCVATRMP